MRRLIFALAGVAVLAAVAALVAVPAQPVAANPLTEDGDAGDLPATAQVATGVGPLTSISGTIASSIEADMYQICLTGGATFSATTSSTIDPQLFLFNSLGRGVYANDNTGDYTSQPTLPALNLLTPLASGVYYLAISVHDVDAVSPDGLIFPSIPTIGLFGPDGPGGGLPINGWGSQQAQVFAQAPYTIALTGAEFCTPRQLYWTDSGTKKIQRANLDGTGVVEDLVTGLVRPLRIALDSAGRQMYWLDGNSADPTQTIKRADMDNPVAVETLLAGPPSDRVGLALDLVSDPQKMYWADFLGRKIKRANLDGSGEELLFTTDYIGPPNVALDVAAGEMYWTLRFGGVDKIQRANMDGTGGVTTLLSFPPASDPRGIALDLVERQMYWVDNGDNTINRAPMCDTPPCTPVTTLVTGLVVPLNIALDVFDRKMYWTDAGNSTIKRAPMCDSPPCTPVTTLVDGPVDGLITPVGIALDLPQVAPAPGNRYCITGTSTGVDWGWELVDPATGTTPLAVGTAGPVAAGGSASDIAGAWVDSMSDEGVDAKQQNTCLRINPTDRDLYVDGCKITGSSSGCSFNPTVFDATGVGGTVELLGQSEPPADASESSARGYTAPIVAAIAAGALVVAAGGWYARRRWLR